jgi:drug/metabolite transporter (DMT)-like permease
LRDPIAQAVALAAFAANSLLARLALGAGTIDPASFTAIRLASGAVVLWLLLRSRGEAVGLSRENLGGAALLFLYAAPFSFAYVTLPTGTGALVLFGAVQFTMIGAGLWAGERPGALEWLGLGAAVAGVVYLNLPGLGAPSPLGVALMGVAGTAWGLYSLRGRNAGPPLLRTGQSFLAAAPAGLLLAAAVAGSDRGHIEPGGALAALVSGALASGGGYAVWYSVLPRLSATRAGTLQLLVPVMAAGAGVVVLGESVTLRLVVSATAILGGVAIALRGGRTTPTRP